MALIVKINVNEKEIHRVVAVRVAGKPPLLCEYRVFVSTEQGSDGLKYIGNLKHLYDDGARILAMKMLALAQEELDGITEK